MTHRISLAGGRQRRAVPAVAALLTVASVLSACSSDANPTAATAQDSDALASESAARTAACRPVPPEGAPLAWFPAELPLPAGSYPIQDVDAAAPPPSAPASDTHRGLLAVHGSVTDFTSFIATEWTAAGWSLGKGDAERGEAEGGYRRGDFGGAYRARDVYCDPTFTELLIVYGPGGATESS
jgi:hypothetical protein